MRTPHPHRTIKAHAGGSWPLIELLLTFGLVILLAGGCGALSSAMTPDSKATNAAVDVGYTDVEIVERTWLFVGLRGCDKNDTVRFTVRGINAQGEKREFYVCAGVLKGGTVRSK